jgi:hypothetical protein
MQVTIHAADARNSHQMLGLFFKKSPFAAGQDGKKLPAGTCAWVDRPLNAAEPDILAQDLPPGFRYQVEYDHPNGHVIHFRPHGAVHGWVDDLHDPNKWWTFYAFNTNQGELKATKSYSGAGVLFDDAQ